MTYSTKKLWLSFCLFIFTLCPFSLLFAPVAPTKSSRPQSLDQITPPKPIQKINYVKKTKKYSDDFFKQFDHLRNTPQDDAFFSLIKSIGQKKKPFRFTDIPFLKIIPLPKELKSFFDNIVMYKPGIKITKKGFIISGQVDIYSVSVSARVVVLKDSAGKTSYSIMVQLPNTWKFSDTFPKTKFFDPKDFDLLEFADVWFALSSTRYHDPILQQEVREGINLAGSIKPTGTLFKDLDRVFGGAISNAGALSMQCAIGLNEKLVGTLLMIDLPSRIKFTDWMETTPLKMIFVVEETVEQTATVAVAVQGGLKLTFPWQKNDPITLGLAGKYIVPTDLEFYAFMDGWVRNAPVKGLHFGNLKFGLSTDLALIAEAGGATAGIGALATIVSGFVVYGGIGVGDKVDMADNTQLSFGIKAALSSGFPIGDLNIVGEGTIRLSDLVGFWLQQAEDVAHIFNKDVNFKKKILAGLPPLKLEDSKFAFVPKESLEEKKRIEITVGKVNIFGMKAEGSLYLSRQGIQGKMYLQKIRIPVSGPPLIILSGAGPDEILNTPDDGLIVKLNLTLPDFDIFADSFLKIPFLGIESASRINISMDALEFAVSHKLAGLFDVDFDFRAKTKNKLIDPASITMSGSVQDKGLNQLVSLITKEAVKALGQARRDVAKANQAVVGWKNQAIKDINNHFNTLKKQTKWNIDQENKKVGRAWKECVRQHPFPQFGIDWNLIPRGVCANTLGVNTGKIAVAALTVHKDVTLEASRATALLGTQFITDVAKIGLATAQANLIIAEALSKAAKEIVRGAFKLTSLKLKKSNLQTLFKAGKLPKISVVGTIFGKKFSQNYQIDFKKPQQFPVQIVQGLMQIIK